MRWHEIGGVLKVIGTSAEECVGGKVIIALCVFAGLDAAMILHHVERDLTQGIGSTDAGNVTHEIPAIQAYIGLKDDICTRTAEFAEAAGGLEGKVALTKAVQLLALSGLDVLVSFREVLI